MDASTPRPSFSPSVSPSVSAPFSVRTARVARAITPASGAIARFVYALADRPVSALFRLWLAIVAACGAAYWLLAWLPWPALETKDVAVAADVRGLLTAVYFSAVTATSVGYGDVVPMGAARLLAIAESVAGLVLFG